MKIITKRLGLAVAVLGLTVGATSRAEAGLIFSNYTSQYTNVTSRGAGNSPLAFITGVASDTTISNIGVLNNLSAAGSIKFVIFDDADTSSPVFVSGPKAFALDPGDNFTLKLSDPFSFTLLAGHQYDIGYVANVATTAPYAFPVESVTQNGITSNGPNANVDNFTNPTFAGRAAASVGVELYATDSVDPVPEPSTVFMAGTAGLVGLVYNGRRKRVAA